MIYVLTFFHIVGCLVLIAVVLLQTGKRADLAGAFGGGGSQTAFGARGAATLLTKMTTGFAVLFMVTSLGLSMVASRTGGGTSVLEGEPGTETPISAPATGGDGGQQPAAAPGADSDDADGTESAEPAADTPTDEVGTDPPDETPSQN